MSERETLSVVIVGGLVDKGAFMEELEDLVLRHGGGGISVFDFEDECMRTLKAHSAVEVTARRGKESA